MNILAYLAALAGLNSGGTARHMQPRRPTGAALRNPSHPAQAARIEAAARKRERKADALHRWDCLSQHYQTASRTYILH